MEDTTVTVLIGESILMSEEFVDILEKEFQDKAKSYIKVIKDNLKVLEKVQLAVRECIEENILRDFLEQHRREVCDMCLKIGRASCRERV